MERVTFINKVLLTEACQEVRDSEKFKGWGIPLKKEVLVLLIAKANILCQNGSAENPGQAIDASLADREVKKGTPEWRIYRAVMFQYYALRKKSKEPPSRATAMRRHTLKTVAERDGQLPLL